MILVLVHWRPSHAELTDAKHRVAPMHGQVQHGLASLAPVFVELQPFELRMNATRGSTVFLVGDGVQVGRRTGLHVNRLEGVTQVGGTKSLPIKIAIAVSLINSLRDLRLIIRDGAKQREGKLDAQSHACGEARGEARRPVSCDGHSRLSRSC